MFGMLWIGVYDSMFQFLPISSNFAQPLKRSGPTFHRPQSTTWSNQCVALCEEDGGHTRYWLVFGTPGPPQYSKTAHFRVAFYCGQPKAHLCNNHAVLFSSLICHTCEVDGLSRQRRSAHGDTLLRGVWIRLTWHLHNNDMTHVMNMKEVLCMFMTTVIKCHLLSYVIF